LHKHPLYGILFRYIYREDVFVLAKKINYDEKIAVLEQKIEKKAAQISALKNELKKLEAESRKEKYESIIEFIDNKRLPLDQVMTALEMVAEDNK